MKKSLPGLLNHCRSIVPAILILFVTTSGCMKSERHGFVLIEKRFVKEVNAECLHFEHVKSGAHLFKIMNDDPNKTFSITFKTLPESDAGTPHIMEHSVLNGSKNFPVKSPFDILSRGSLSTFINAFTSKDFTMYPIASMNDKDYFNLMHVYLDAVFNPLIYSDPRIMRQEGWHYELMESKGPLTYKGVVYNEMKGAFSDPERELWYHVYRNLYPDNCYRYESGGYPPAIPTLTNEAFIEFHEKYYHPANSYIFLYGNADMDKELAFIDSAYLSRYEKPDSLPLLPDQKPFDAIKEFNGHFSVLPGSETKDQTFLSMNWVAGYNTDLALCMSLELLAELLVNQESAPLRIALQQAGIGQDVSASIDNLHQNLFQITVKNANPGDKDKFREILTGTLNEMIKKGIDKKEIEGVLNRKEFQLREGNDAQKGLAYLWKLLPGWFYANDPFTGLEYEKPLAEVKKTLKSNYLEDIIATHLIKNMHGLLLTLAPEPGLDQKRNAEQEEELRKKKSSLAAAEIETLINETKELIDYQKREDSPEALATIPMLTLQDIDRKASWYEAVEKPVSGFPVIFHEEFTNNIVYVNLFFDLNTVPQELIPYASLLTNLLGSLNTRHHSYSELNQALNSNTGSYQTNLKTFLEKQDDDLMISKLMVSSKVMPDKLDTMFNLCSEMLTQTLFDDTARLKTLLIRHQSQMDAAINQDGFLVAHNRLNSYISKKGVFDEMTEGLDYYWFVSDLVKNFRRDQPLLVANLEKVAQILVSRNNIIAAVTCSREDFEKFATVYPGFIAKLPDSREVKETWILVPEIRNEGLLAPSKVQYVMAGYNYKKLGYQWNGKMRVLSQVLSTDWLQNQVRVIGGAYGGWSEISPNGNLVFNSYRDPNLAETLENYQSTTRYLDEFNADEKTMTRYIIGTIAGMDVPMTPSQKGDLAFSWYFGKRTRQEIEENRHAVLETKSSDIKGFAKMITDVMSQGVLCVYGNPEKIEGNKKLFKNIVKIGK